MGEKRNQGPTRTCCSELTIHVGWAARGPGGLVGCLKTHGITANHDFGKVEKKNKTQTNNKAPGIFNFILLKKKTLKTFLLL